VQKKARVVAPNGVEQLIVLLSETIQPCYQHHLLPTLDIVDSIADDIIHSKIYSKGKSPTSTRARWESVLTRGILAGLSVSHKTSPKFQKADLLLSQDYMEPMEQLDKSWLIGISVPLMNLPDYLE
jgi:hypothetical protein